MKIKSIFCDEESIGDMVLSAVENSRGRVVSLLDDDDVYLPGKLAAVSNAMSDSSIGYYHNNAAFFGPSAGYAESKVKQTRVETMITPASSIAEILKAVDDGATFNSSCVAFQREILTRQKGLIQGTPSGPGFSVFVASLLEGKRNLVHPARLTGYRTRHRSSGGVALREKTIAIQKAAETLQIVATHAFMGPVKEVIRYKVGEMNVRLYLLVSASSRQRAGNFPTRLITIPTIHKPKYRAILFLLAAMWPIVPEGARSRIRNLPEI